MMDSHQPRPVTSPNALSAAPLSSSSGFRSPVGQQSGITSSGGSKPPLVTAESITSITAHRRKRLVRSENVTSGGSGCLGSGRSGSRNHHYSHHYGAWESIFRESLLHMAWPISLSMSTDGSADPSVMMDFLPLKIRYSTVTRWQSPLIAVRSQWWNCVKVHWRTCRIENWPIEKLALKARWKKKKFFFLW